MSIIITGMEMPRSCYKCAMRRRDGMDIVCPVAHERFSVADVNILEYRLDNCPLVPVPPHGRLIDGDVAEAICFTDEDADGGKDFIDGVLFAADFISQQPTIIQAEEEGET